MAKATRNESQITKVAGTTANFLTKYAEDKSLDLLQQYVTIPRIKIIQSMTDQKLKEAFGEGAAIVRPGDALLYQKDSEPFLFVPEFFFVEYCLWRDRRDQSGTMIIERTYDPTNDVAKKAEDKDQRTVIYEGDEGKPERERRFFSYVKHLCFPGKLYSGDFKGTAVVMSFERGEIGQGFQFINALSMRREDAPDPENEGQTIRAKVPLWAQVWSFTTGFRDKPQGKWYGFDFTAAGVISDNDADVHHQDHLELMKLHDENKLRVDHGGNEGAGEGEAAGAAAAAQGTF